jgi:hypothetical protein
MTSHKTKNQLSDKEAAMLLLLFGHPNAFTTYTLAQALHPNNQPSSQGFW